MAGATDAMNPSDLFLRPSSTFLWGRSRPLLNWVAYALASTNPAGYRWTEVREGGGKDDDLGPVSQARIPASHLSLRTPKQLRQSDAEANLAIGAIVRSEGGSGSVPRIVDFLRLPAPTQALLSKLPVSASPIVIALANGDRIVHLYPEATVDHVLRTIVEGGVCLLVTYADVARVAHLHFDHVLHLEGSGPRSWREATLRIEKGPDSGPLRTGRTFRLADVGPVAAVLSPALDGLPPE